MPWYKEYKGKNVWWVTKGYKKPKHVGYAQLTTRRPAVFFEGRGNTVASYKRIPDAEVKRRGLEKRRTSRRRRKQRHSLFGELPRF